MAARRLSAPTSGLLAPLLVFAGAAAFLGALRGYGFQVEDEGLILFQFDRVWRGQVPYVDFHTGYTPGLYYGAVAVFAWLGRSALAIRTVLAALNATSAMLLYVFGRRLVGPGMALVAPLLWLVLVPLYPGEFAALNVPYPTWPATVTWLVLALALVRWVRRDGLVWVAIAGAAAATTLAVRPNSGAFAIAAATWVVVAFARRATALDRAAAVGASAFMALGVWIVLDRRIVGTDAVVHVWPMLALAFGCVGAFARPRGDANGATRAAANGATRVAADGATPAAGATRTVTALAVLGGVFLVPTAAWMLYFLVRLGPALFAREVLLLGSQYAVLYYRPHPAPELYALAVVGSVLAFVGTGWLVRRGRVAPLPLVGLALGAVVVAAAGIARFAVMPEGAPASFIFQVENALFWLVPLANVGGLVALAHAARERRDDDRTRVLTVLTAFAIATYLQMYPRSDVMHQITAAPVALLLGVVLLDRVLDWWEAGCWPAALGGRSVVRGIVAAVVALVVATKLGLALPGIVAVATRSGLAPAAPGLPVAVEVGAGDDLAAVHAAAAYIADHTDPDEPVFAFPATIGVLFAADRPNPVPHDYWFPGRPDHAVEATVLARLRSAPPRYVVTLNAGWTFFADAPAYFLDTRAFVVANYRLAARFGRFDVLARRALVGDAPVVMQQPTGPLTDALRPALAERRQGARRWVAGLTPAEAAAATLPADLRTAMLLLRAIRDGGDMRAAGWIVAGYRSAEPRVHREALKTMPYLVEEIGARRLRWADDESPPDAAPFVRPWADAARAMLADPEAAPFARALLDVAGTPTE